MTEIWPPCCVLAPRNRHNVKSKGLLYRKHGCFLRENNKCCPQGVVEFPAWTTSGFCWKMVIHISRDENIFLFFLYAVKLSARLISGVFTSSKGASLAHFNTMCVWLTGGLIIHLEFPNNSAIPLMLIRTVTSMTTKHLFCDALFRFEHFRRCHIPRTLHFYLYASICRCE